MKRSAKSTRSGLRSCRSKKRYVTSRHANRTARHRMRNGCTHPLRAYECPYCGGYHLTSKPLFDYTGAAP